MLQILPEMVKYLEEHRNSTMISMIYGIYRVKMPGLNPVDLFI